MNIKYIQTTKSRQPISLKFRIVKIITDVTQYNNSSLSQADEQYWYLYL